MENFCGKCGTYLDRETGLCPNCDAAQIKEYYKKLENSETSTSMQETEGTSKERWHDKRKQRKVAKNEKQTKRSTMGRVRRFFLKLICAVFLLAVLVIGASGVLVYFNIVEVPIMANVLERTGIKQETFAFSDQQISDSYIPNEENIIYENESKTNGYVNNMILLFAYSDVTVSRISEIAENLGGQIVGEISGIYQYQIQVSPMSKEELEILCGKAMEFKEIKYAIIDTVFAMDTEELKVPNDPWKDTFQGTLGVDWNEEKPNGYNWWLEATKVPSAWKYRDSFSSINIGIVDNGFDTSHEDLDMIVLNNAMNSIEHHGTHVAGIIGATNDNQIGITGILDKVNLYGVDCYATSKQEKDNVATSTLLAGIELCISKDCKVVNMSSGINSSGIDPTKIERMEQTKAAAEETARNAILYLISMLDAKNEGNDFIIVQSAGNGDKNKKGVDAQQYAGFFASITKELVEETFEYLDENSVQLEHNISVQDVLDSYMVVGAVDKKQKKGTWQLGDFSNYGNTITVCAPGVDVFSTTVMGGVDGNYANDSGTSMAAPIVSGITAMVWSVNQDMRAGDIKNIIQQTADISVLSRREKDEGTYYMINAVKAVETALNYSSENPKDRFVSPIESSEEKNSALEKYLVAVKKTTESGSWSEQFALEADMSVSYGTGEAKTKMVLNSNSDVSNYIEDDLSQIEISGLTDMTIMGQTYEWSTEYKDGIAQYNYTKPIERLQSIEMEPNFFDFGSISYETILEQQKAGNQIYFTISGDKMTEIGLAAIKQIREVSDLKYGDIEVIVTLDDSEYIKEIVMKFNASMEYQGYHADVDYKIKYNFT